MAEVIAPLTAMTTEGKDALNIALQNLVVGTQTNLSAGLLKGLELIRTRDRYIILHIMKHHIECFRPNDVASILLFTDGLANLGIKEEYNSIHSIFRISFMSR